MLLFTGSSLVIVNIIVCTYVLMSFTFWLWPVKLVTALCVSVSIPVFLSICLPLLFYFELHLHWEMRLGHCALGDKAQVIIACSCAKTCAIPNIEVSVQPKNSSHKSSTGRLIFNSNKLPSCSKCASGYQPPLKNTTPSFLSSPPFKSAYCPSNPRF